MKEEVTVGYSTSNGKEGEFTFEMDEKSLKIIDKLDSPIAILKNAGSLGVKGASVFFTTLVAAIFINVVFLIWALIVAISDSFSTGLVSLIIVFVAGVLFTLFLGQKAYAYVFINVLNALYNGLSPLVKKLCGAIIDKTAEELHKRKATSLLATNSVNIYGIFNEKLNMLPRYARKSVWFVIKRVPFIKFLDHEITEIILGGKKQEATNMLYNKTNDFINNTVFGTNSLTTVWLLLVLNIAVQLLFIFLNL